MSGAVPLSTHVSSAVTASYSSVEGPPAQWFMPGIRNRRAKLAASAPYLSCRLCKYRIVSSGEKIGSAVPCTKIILPPLALNASMLVDVAASNSIPASNPSLPLNTFDVSRSKSNFISQSSRLAGFSAGLMKT